MATTRRGTIGNISSAPAAAAMRRILIVCRIALVDAMESIGRLPFPRRRVALVLFVFLVPFGSGGSSASPLVRSALRSGAFYARCKERQLRQPGPLFP